MDDKNKALKITYQLFSEIFLGPINRKTVERINLVPELKDLLDSVYGLEGISENELVDKLACEHHAIFELQVYPYQCCFLGSNENNNGSTLLNTPDALSAIYTQCGFQHESLSSVRPDHFGAELLFLSYLLTIESNDSKPSKQAQAKFLHGNVLSWIYPFRMALNPYNNLFFSQLLDIVLDVVLDHWSDVQGFYKENLNTMANETHGDTSNSEDFLQQSDTSFDKICQKILNPSDSGIYLSHDLIGKISNQIDLPKPFGDRHQTLTDLFKGSLNYGCFPKLIEELQSQFICWQEDLETAPPELMPYLDSWISKSKGSLKMLGEIANASAGK